MTTRATEGYIIEIEGLMRRTLGQSVDSDDYFQTLPMALSTMSEPGAPDDFTLANRSTDLWIPLLRADRVTLSGQSWKPLSGDVEAQTLEFSVVLSKDYPEIESFLFAKAKPVTTLTADFTPGDTSITVASATGITAGSIVYIRRMAFRVSSVVGTTVNLVNRVRLSTIWPASRETDATTLAALTEGDLGHANTRVVSVAVPNPSDPAPWPDNRVWLKNPKIAGRRVQLRRVSWGLNATGGWQYREQLIGQFTLNREPPTIGSDGVTVTLRATSFTASLRDSQVNRAPLRHRVQVRQALGYREAFWQLDQSADAGQRRVWKVGLTSTDISVMCVSAGSNALVTRTPYLLEALTNDFRLTYTVARVIDGRNLGLTPYPNTDGTTIQSLRDGGDARQLTDQLRVEADWKDAFEVLASDPFDMPVSQNDVSATPSTHPFYCTDLPGASPGVLRHPLHMLLAHFRLLTCPNLPNHWCIPMAVDDVAVDDLLALSRGPLASIDQWPGVVAGKDGKPLKFLEWAYGAYLQGIGGGWAVDQHGRLTVRVLTALPASALTLEAGTVLVAAGQAGYGEVTTATALYGRSTMATTENATDDVQAQIGQGLSESPRLTVSALDSYRADYDAPGAGTLVVNAAGAASPDYPATSNLELIDLPAVQAVRASMTMYFQLLEKAGRQYTIRVLSGTPSLNAAFDPSGTGVQSYAAPGLPAFYAPPGTLVDVRLQGLRTGQDGDVPDPPELRSCVVVGHSWARERGFSVQELELFDLVAVSTRIAPAARIVSATEVSGNTEIVVESAYTILPGPLPYSPLPLALSADSEQFTQVGAITGSYYFGRVYDSTLAFKAGPFDLSSTSATDTFTVPGTGFGIVAGDWLLMAEFGESDALIDGLHAFFGLSRYTL